MQKTTKEKVLRTLNKSDNNKGISQLFDRCIVGLILLNVVVVMLETVESFELKYGLIFHYFEVFSSIVFSFEYLVRLWACTAIKKYQHPVWGRLKYMGSTEAIIDLIAIFPFYFPLIFQNTDTRIVRILRLLRLFRIFKLGRYSLAFTLIMDVIKSRKEELIASLTLLIILLVFSSSLMYYVEYNPEKEGFRSIPETMWWGVATLTTVGYGDVYPITPLGKILGAFIAILGVGLFALPAGIIASGFESELRRNKKN